MCGRKLSQVIQSQLKKNRKVLNNRTIFYKELWQNIDNCANYDFVKKKAVSKNQPKPIFKKPSLNFNKQNTPQKYSQWIQSKKLTATFHQFNSFITRSLCLFLVVLDFSAKVRTVYNVMQVIEMWLTRNNLIGCVVKSNGSRRNKVIFLESCGIVWFHS